MTAAPDYPDHPSATELARDVLTAEEFTAWQHREPSRSYRAAVGGALRVDEYGYTREGEHWEQYDGGGQDG